ncbi:hypothetical protein K437DRAFT_164673 [Tilletiaria anomala UBC 951]|uniref:Uncharacterized protein n=1 Tax=Tilletiaria anomala (strain ATCC 24038 / CBS 436.72 / UBC 951) TaxID=1037660 RepID=A0A066VQ74_TILAU|nr:uncharacterized protein K437DRAFT_164673 [Tilletiaria anomala UBC 951]KDN42408.1 hypothetical protein K437DRAFT_164673 [Tilletiaria anomala UBC 951]
MATGKTRVIVFFLLQQPNSGAHLLFSADVSSFPSGVKAPLSQRYSQSAGSTFRPQSYSTVLNEGNSPSSSIQPADSLSPTLKSLPIRQRETALDLQKMAMRGIDHDSIVRKKRMEHRLAALEEPLNASTQSAKNIANRASAPSQEPEEIQIKFRVSPWLKLGQAGWDL